MHATRIIHWYLKKEPDPAKRGSYLSEAMRASGGLYIPAMKTAMEADREKEAQNPDAFILDVANVEELKAMCVQKIRDAAATNRLATHPELARLLNIWGSWASPEEPKLWVDSLTKSREGLIHFLVALTGKATSTGLGDYVGTEHWYIDLKGVELYIEPTVLEERIKLLQPKSQNEAETRALAAFEKALQRRREGKSEGPPWMDF